MRGLFQAGVILLWGVLLAGCSGLAPREPVTVPAADAWVMEGRLALRVEDAGWHANIHWEQRPGNYRIRLYGPLGQGALELTGTPAGVFLQRSNGQVSQARDPDILLYQETGWQLPVSGLRYWVRGRVQPQLEYSLRRDEQGRPVELQQAGWDIRYTDFFDNAATILPRRIQLVNGDIRVKLIIDQWQRPGTDMPEAAG